MRSLIKPNASKIQKQIDKKQVRLAELEDKFEQTGNSSFKGKITRHNIQIAALEKQLDNL